MRTLKCSALVIEAKGHRIVDENQHNKIEASFICCECVIRSIFEGYLGKLPLARKRMFF